jgi:hypothetical protein
MWQAADTGIRLLLPFCLSNGLESLDGQLELILGDPDPLPLLIEKDVSDGDVIRAWTCALVGFADVTCIDIESATSRQPSSKPRSASPRLQHRTSVRLCPGANPGRAILNRLAAGSNTQAPSWPAIGDALTKVR